MGPSLRELVKLLTKLFNPFELRRLLGDVLGDHQHGLPNEPASMDQLSETAVELLARHDKLPKSFGDALREARPKLCEEIDCVLEGLADDEILELKADPAIRETRRALLSLTEGNLKYLAERTGLRRAADSPVQISRVAETNLHFAASQELEPGYNRHLVVTGEAGAGKSWVVWRWLQRLSEATPKPDILWLAAIDWPFGLPVDELHRAFEDWRPSAGAWLVIDGVDELRDPDRERNLVAWLRKVDDAPSWRIVGTMREVDLLMKAELRKLFRRSAARGTVPGLADCARISVGRLSDEELPQLEREHPVLFSWWSQRPTRLRDELRSPFALWIAADLLAEGVDLRAPTGLAGLLRTWWGERLPGDQRYVLESRLREICGRLVEQVSPQGFDVAADTWVIGLKSHGVLDEDQGWFRFRSAILQDSAIEQFWLRMDVAPLIEQLTDDPRRARLLFPALSMRLARWWDEDREKFWQLHDRLLRLPKPQPLLALAASRLLVEVAHHLENLRPLLEGFDHDVVQATRAANRLTGVLIALDRPRLGENAGPWSALAAALAERREAVDASVWLMHTLLPGETMAAPRQAIETASAQQRKDLHTAASRLVTEARRRGDRDALERALYLLMPVLDEDSTSSLTVLEGLFTDDFIAEEVQLGWVSRLPSSLPREQQSAAWVLFDILFSSVFRLRCRFENNRKSLRFIGSSYLVHALGVRFGSLSVVDPVWATRVLRTILSQDLDGVIDELAMGDPNAWQNLESMRMAWRDAVRQADDLTRVEIAAELHKEASPRWMIDVFESRAHTPEHAASVGSQPVTAARELNEEARLPLPVCALVAEFGISLDGTGLVPLLLQLTTLLRELRSVPSSWPSVSDARAMLAERTDLAERLRSETDAGWVEPCLQTLDTLALVRASQCADLAEHPAFAAELTGWLLAGPRAQRVVTNWAEANLTVGLINVAAHPELRSPELLSAIRGCVTHADPGVRAAAYEGWPRAFPTDDQDIWSMLRQACDDEPDVGARQSLLKSLARLCSVEPVRASDLLARRLQVCPTEVSVEIARAMAWASVGRDALPARDWLRALTGRLASDHEFAGPVLAIAVAGLIDPQPEIRYRAACLFRAVAEATADPDLPSAVVGKTLSDWGVWWRVALDSVGPHPRTADPVLIDLLLRLLEGVFPRLAREHRVFGFSDILGGLALIVELRPLRVLDLVVQVPPEAAWELLRGPPILGCLRVLLGHPEITTCSVSLSSTYSYLDRLVDLHMPEAIALAIEHAQLADT